ncbi:unnamed protein product [Lathyrus oleraceus]
MGGLLHFFEFNQGRMAKKVRAHKRHHVDFETPRNSLDLQVETSQKYGPRGELPHYYQVEEDWLENNRYSNTGSMKKLINEELSARSSTRQNAPSIVARLMGLDMMPVETKSAVPSDKRITENTAKKYSNKRMNGSNFNSSSHIEFDAVYEAIDDDDDDGWSRSFGEPRPREHPQEEELQKFKKEFEAYQAARFQECSRFAEIGSVSSRLIFQENLNKEKVAHNTSMQRKVFPSKSRTLSRDFEESLMIKSYNRLAASSSPTRIVILKPGPDSIFGHEENWTSASGTLPGRHSIEDFLEEVKERLKCELQGKNVAKGYAVRGSEIETLRNKKPSDPKLIARQIVKQVKENVNRDSDSNSGCSESTRSYKGEVKLNGPNYPEFISRDPRSYLSEKLTNTVKSERRDDDICEVNSRSHAFDNQRVRLKKTEGVLHCANEWEISKEETEIQTGSFRHEQDNDILLHRGLLSPRNLVRSLSAPVSRSGTSFGKLLLEDRHILTGAHIRRKLEAVETMAVDVKKQKKERFNHIKERVSNFRYSFALRGRLFGKRNQSMAESRGNEYLPAMRDIRSGPTVLMNCGSERHENYTEVPPSPASVCSSVHEDFWRRTEYLSPISTPDVSSRDDTVMPQVFRDISTGLNELRRQLNQLDSGDVDVEDFAMKHEPSESELMQINDPAESYIRDLLLASGLYFGSWDKSLLRGDTYAKPIGNSVFEEVEESHKNLINENDASLTKDQGENSHKILLDLLNEALSIVLGPPSTLSKFRKKLCKSSMLSPPQGKELLKLVWENIRVSLYPSSDISHYSVDTLVAQHLSSLPWSGIINDEMNILGREVECLITNDLVEELTKDLI